jgi:hypothetical protein
MIKENQRPLVHPSQLNDTVDLDRTLEIVQNQNGRNNNLANNEAQDTFNSRTAYKIPTLTRRFLAEVFDCIYIQFFKIILVILLLNYTDLM